MAIDEGRVFADCETRLSQVGADRLATELGYETGLAWLQDSGEVPANIFGQINIFCPTSLSDRDTWTRVLLELFIKFGIPYCLYEGPSDPNYATRQKQLDRFRERTGFAELSDFYVVNATDPEYAIIATATFADKTRRGVVIVSSSMAQEPLDSLRSQIGFAPKAISYSPNLSENRLCNVFGECHSFLQDSYKALRPLYDHYSSAVFLLHGKGTFGSWVQKFKTKLEAHGFYVESASFDFVHQGNFLTPGQFFLNKKVRQVSEEFAGFCERVGARKKFAIAHSYGSFLMGRALEDKPSCLEGGLIFCGSIATREMQPALSAATGDSRRIVNDVGVSDRWPAVATGWLVPYGQVGYEGFKRAGINDRFHAGIGHQGFFTEDFVEKYWVSFLSQGEIVQGSAEHMNDSGWWRLQSLVPLEVWLVLIYATAALVIFLIAMVVNSLFGLFWALLAFLFVSLASWVAFHRLI